LKGSGLKPQYWGTPKTGFGPGVDSHETTIQVADVKVGIEGLCAAREPKKGSRVNETGRMIDGKGEVQLGE